MWCQIFNKLVLMIDTTFVCFCVGFVEFPLFSGRCRCQCLREVEETISKCLWIGRTIHKLASIEQYLQNTLDMRAIRIQLLFLWSDTFKFVMVWQPFPFEISYFGKVDKAFTFSWREFILDNFHFFLTALDIEWAFTKKNVFIIKTINMRRTFIITCFEYRHTHPFIYRFCIS